MRTFKTFVSLCTVYYNKTNLLLYPMNI
uniref:Uncharacterized protein n=1 Tax=Arundo donax TaxID=35708 RepID=A0A0A9A509_ARUDO